MEEKNMNYENDNVSNDAENIECSANVENVTKTDSETDKEIVSTVEESSCQECSVANNDENTENNTGSLSPEEDQKVIYRWNYHDQLRANREREEREKRKGKLLYAAVLCSAFLVAILLLVGTLLMGGFSKAGRGDTSISELYAECLPSYVAINVTTPFSEGTGSGIVITADGYIATNYHVIEGAESITVIMSNETKYDAEFIDGDALNDIAVIKIDAEGLTPARLGSSKNSKIGDQVMAIGTPHSIDYRGTMTSGYISYLDRRYVEENANGTVSKVLYLIQTDTTVNPGNSGGPLFNMDGEVIGIITLKISGTSYEGLGFALPIESVIGMISDIIENGEITDPNAGGASQGAALGITGFAVTKDTKYLLSDGKHFEVKISEETNEEVILYPMPYTDIEVPIADKEMLERYGITEYSFLTTEADGIYVVNTTEQFDAAQKLQIGDILISGDGYACTKMSDIKSFIADKRIGDTIDFQVYRNGKTISVTVELGSSSNFEE